MSCDLPLSLKEKNCVSDCGATYYVNKVTNKCEKCLDATCLTCGSDSPSKCTSCSSTLFLLDGKCVPDCGLSYYKDTSNNLCIKCSN